jgi:hypothetical protein
MSGAESYIPTNANAISFATKSSRRCIQQKIHHALNSHLKMCKPLKHAALLHPLNRSLLFSTLFFTELLKRSRNYWKQICAVIRRETSQQNKSRHAVEWFSLTHAAQKEK